MPGSLVLVGLPLILHPRACLQEHGYSALIPATFARCASAKSILQTEDTLVRQQWNPTTKAKGESFTILFPPQTHTVDLR